MGSVYYHLIEELQDQCRSRRLDRGPTFTKDSEFYLDLVRAEAILFRADRIEAAYRLDEIIKRLDANKQDSFDLYHDLDVVRKLLIDDEDESKLFDGEIFLGNASTEPQNDFSGQRVQLLHARLSQALSLLSGIQQAPRPTDPKESHQEYVRECEESERKLRVIVRDLSVALIGKEPTAYAEPKMKSVASTSDDDCG